MQPNHKQGNPFSIEPVCGMKLDADQPPFRWVYQGTDIHFCSEVCKQLFQRELNK
jgi:YHS domain-containing protein